jgi:hypothetical protein
MDIPDHENPNRPSGHLTPAHHDRVLLPMQLARRYADGVADRHPFDGWNLGSAMKDACPITVFKTAVESVGLFWPARFACGEAGTSLPSAAPSPTNCSVR